MEWRYWRSLREKVNVDGIQIGYMHRKVMADAIFVVWQPQEKFLVGINHCFMVGSGEIGDWRMADERGNDNLWLMGGQWSIQSMETVKSLRWRWGYIKGQCWVQYYSWLLWEHWHLRLGRVCNGNCCVQMI